MAIKNINFVNVQQNDSDDANIFFKLGIEI